MFIPLSPLRCLARAAELYGRKEGVVCGDLRFTYAQFAERCARLAGALMAEGIEPLDRVGYLSFNTHRLLEGYFGVVQAGAIAMPLNVRLTPSELAAILSHSEARFLFYESDFAPLIAHFKQQCPGIVKYQLLDNSYEDFIARSVPAPLDVFAVDENTTAELFYTSGSTGSPKGVALSHRTLHLHALSVVAMFHQDDTAVELHTIPLFHANGWGRPQSTTLMGGRHVMVRRFDPGTVFRLIEAERATSMLLVPTMANALLNAPDVAQHDYSSLRDIHLGGAASSPELIGRLEKAFRCSCVAGYGLTETGPVATTARHKSTVIYADEADRLRHQAMAGWPLPGISVRVVDAAMHDVPRDMTAIGEVVIMGDQVMDSYFHEPEATAGVMTGAWFHSGDMAVWDEENYVHIVDRKKDIIISGGENISSIEVEQAICRHPSVIECAVVSAPDDKWGEVPAALIVLKEHASLSNEILSSFLEENLAKFKMPRYVEFLSGPLPKTGTGKIMKRELREKFWSGKKGRVQG